MATNSQRQDEDNHRRHRQEISKVRPPTERMRVPEYERTEQYNSFVGAKEWSGKVANESDNVVV